MDQRDIKLIILSISIATSIYLIPRSPIQPVNGLFWPAIDWGRHHILKTGYVLTQSEHPTYIANLRGYGAIDRLPKILYAMINIVTGVVSFPASAKLLTGLPWIGALLIPTFALAAYQRNTIRNGYSRIDGVLVVLVALFPLASVLDNLSGGLNASIPARGLFLVCLYTLSQTYISENSRRWAFLSVGVSAVMFEYYHTWAYYLFIYIVIIFVEGLLFNNRRQSTIAAGLTTFIFVITGLWVNKNLIAEPLFLIITSPLLEGSFGIFGQESIDPYRALAASSDIGIYTTILRSHALIIGLIGILFAGFVGKKQLQGVQDLEGRIWLLFGIGQGFVSIALFVRSGIGAISGRILQAPTVLIIFLTAYLLSEMKGHFGLFIRVLAVLMIVFGAVGYIIAPPAVDSSLSPQEMNGIRYAGTYTGHTPILTDFRLATPMLYFDKLEIHTYHGERDDPAQLKAVLRSSYYSNATACPHIDGYLDKSNYFVLTGSSQSTKGVQDVTKKFRPANDNFQSAWDRDRNYHKTFSDGSIKLYKRTTTKCR